MKSQRQLPRYMSNVDLIAEGYDDRTVQERVKTEMRINIEMFKKVEDQLSSYSSYERITRHIWHTTK